MNSCDRTRFRVLGLVIVVALALVVATTVCLIIANGIVRSKWANLVNEYNGDVVRLVDFLERHNVDLDASIAVSDGTTSVTGDEWIAPLLMFVAQGDFEAARVLIEHGANPDIADSQGRTAIHYAVLYRPSGQMIEMLAEAGADLDAVNSVGETPLLASVRTGSVDAAETLLARGVDPNQCYPRSGHTAMDTAAAGGDLDIVNLLLTHGATIEGASCERSNPLAAVVQGYTLNQEEVYLDLLEILMAQGPADSMLYDALEYAIHFQDRGVLIRAFLDAGADPNHISESARPLGTAVMHGTPEAVAALLDAGAEPVLYNDPPITLVDVARHRDDEYSASIAQMLLEHQVRSK